MCNWKNLKMINNLVVKILVVALVFEVLFVPQIVSAQNLDEQSNVLSVTESEYQRINDFIIGLRYNVQATEKKVPLYNLEEGVNGWLYILEPAGFVITDENGYIVEANQTIDFEIRQKIYYGGYNEYYNKCDDNNFTHIMLGEVINSIELQEKITNYNGIKEMLYEQKDIMTLAITTSDYVPGTLSNYTDDGTLVDDLGVCGYVASAIFWIITIDIYVIIHCCRQDILMLV